MMVSEKTALKFFKGIDEAMKQHPHLARQEYKITGVLKDVPESSHMQFDILRVDGNSNQRG